MSCEQHGFVSAGLAVFKQSMSLRVGGSESFQGGRRSPCIRLSCCCAIYVCLGQLRLDVERWTTCTSNPLPAALESIVYSSRAREVMRKVITRANTKKAASNKQEEAYSLHA